MVIRRLSRSEALVIVENFDNPLRSVTQGPGTHATHVYVVRGEGPAKGRCDPIEHPDRFFAFHFDTSLRGAERYIGGEEIDEAEANTYHDDLAPN